MGLFSRLKSNTFESMDELEQMDLADGLGITDIKKDIRSIKAQLTDLKNSSNWKANIITANEAAWRLQQIEDETLPKELNKAFVAIDEAINDERDSLILVEYTKEYATFDFPRYEMVRVYHIENLAEALRKYGYKVDVYDPEDEYGLRIKIYLRDDRLESSKIDPDKKYILPMEGTEAEDCLGNITYSYAAKREGGSWYIGQESPFADPKIHFTVTVKDIEEAPEWVKAIKPIEVEE